MVLFYKYLEQSFKIFIKSIQKQLYHNKVKHWNIFKGRTVYKPSTRSVLPRTLLHISFLAGRFRHCTDHSPSVLNFFVSALYRLVRYKNK